MDAQEFTLDFIERLSAYRILLSDDQPILTFTLLRLNQYLDYVRADLNRVILHRVVREMENLNQCKSKDLLLEALGEVAEDNPFQGVDDIEDDPDYLNFFQEDSP
jgi:hypothetical protein